MRSEYLGCALTEIFDRRFDLRNCDSLGPAALDPNDMRIIDEIRAFILAAVGCAFRLLRSSHRHLRKDRRRNVNSDFATFIRTIVILCALAAILAGTGQWQSPSSVSARSYWFLVLSGLATGGSWVCYFRALKLGDAARVAPIDKLSVVLVAVFGVVFLGERLSIPNGWGSPLSPPALSSLPTNRRRTGSAQSR